MTAGDGPRHESALPSGDPTLKLSRAELRRMPMETLLGRIRDMFGNEKGFQQQDVAMAESKLRSRVGHMTDEEYVAAIIDELLNPSQPDPASPASSLVQPVPSNVSTAASLPGTVDAQTTMNKGVSFGPANAPDADSDVQKAIALSLQHQNAQMDDEAALQKAIEISAWNLKKESGPQPLPAGVTREDVDMEKALKESMANSAPVSVRLGLARRTPPDWPAGLLNVNSSCWFSILAQALFHLPRFRHLVLSCDAEVREGAEVPSPRAEFMQELQKLFGLLLLSPRQAVDPSAVLRLLRAQTALAQTSGQEDVSEATHSLLDLVEASLKELSYGANAYDPLPSLPASPAPQAQPQGQPQPQPPAQAVEPSGEFVPESVVEDLFFTATVQGASRKLEKHLLLQVEVAGQSSVEDGLESTLTTELEGSGVTNSWLARAPPVLILDLKRFQFDQKAKQTEKLHSRLTFPKTLYLDPFLARNAAEAVQIRGKVAAAREELAEVKARLAAYANYRRSGVALDKLLALAHTYITDCAQPSSIASGSSEPSSNATTSASAPAAISSSSSSHTAGTPGSSTAPSPPSGGADASMETDSPDTVTAASSGVPEAMDTDEADADAHVPRPAAALPNGIAAQLQALFDDKLAEITNQVEGLKTRQAELESQISGAFASPEFEQCGYRLHACLVHEGSANSGHYWTYLRDPPSGKGSGEEAEEAETWKKFNDINVSNAVWAQVEKDSFGGEGYASAYCLVYVSTAHLASVYGLGEELVGRVSGAEASAEGLPSRVKAAVEQDRVSYATELEAAANQPPSPPSDPQQRAWEEEVCEEWERGTEAVELIRSHAALVNESALHHDLLSSAMESRSPADQALVAEVRAVEERLLPPLASVAEWAEGGDSDGGALEDLRLSHPLHLALATQPLPQEAVRRRLLLWPLVQAVPSVMKGYPDASPTPLAATLASLMADAPLDAGAKAQLFAFHRGWLLLRESAVLLKKISDEFLHREPSRDQEILKFFCLLVERQREARDLLPGLQLYPALTDSLKLHTILRIARHDARSFWARQGDELGHTAQRYRTFVAPLVAARPCPATAHIAVEVQSLLLRVWARLASQSPPNVGTENRHGEVIAAVMDYLNDLDASLKSPASVSLALPAGSGTMKAKITVSASIRAEMAATVDKLAKAGLLPTAANLHQALLDAEEELLAS